MPIKKMPKTKLRVLIVDDEEVIANTLAMILNQSGFEAHAVYSGEEAIEKLQHLNPDILISDVVMSGINGIETAIKVSETLPSCTLALCSQCNAQQLTSFEEAHARSPGSGAPADDCDHALHTITPRHDRKGKLYEICEGPYLPFVSMA